MYEQYVCVVGSAVAVVYVDIIVVVVCVAAVSADIVAVVGVLAVDDDGVADGDDGYRYM